MLESEEKTISLQRLGHKYKTDKAIHHKYCASVYPFYLNSRRSHALTLLELGVKLGKSLKMWRDFFPHGNIAGIDKKIHIPPHPHLLLFEGRQEDKQFLASVVDKIGPPDIIIDDASHQYVDQVVSFETLFPLLKSRGLYFVEDLRGATAIVKYFSEIAEQRSIGRKKTPGVRFVHFWYEMVVIGKT